MFFFFFSKLSAGQIFIKINNIDEEVGFMHFAIYDDPNFFPENHGKTLGLKKNVKDVIENGVIIKDLKSYYAIAIYHDKNSNNEFDTFLSIPQERYGFSNDAEVFLDHLFDEAALFLKENESLEIEISLR